MRIYSYVSLLFILSFNQRSVFCRHVVYDNTRGTEEKYKLLRDKKDVHNPNVWHHITSNDREQNNRDHNRIIFPDYEESSDGHSIYKPLDMETCVLSCKLNPNSDHVCGTDGKTYDNMDHLLCAAKCGVDVRLSHISSCLGRTGRKPTIETNNIDACMSLCPTTSEYNPVCGTNNKTYPNPGKLQCAQECGVDVQLKYHFTCPKTPTTTANPSVSTGSPLPTTNSDIGVCINSCPTTSEYNPVCGSDGKTYYNIGKLECAKYCGIDVQLRYHFACRKTPATMANGAGSTGPHLPSQLIRMHNLL
ncbi:unnamed protein product, partial [Brenthis ino]